MYDRETAAWPDLTDVLTWIYYRKAAARRFDTTQDILRSLSLAQSFLMDRNVPI